MRLGIDAWNIRAGGGLTHLSEMLAAAEPREHGFEQVSVWGGTATLSRVQDRPWLVKIHEPALDKALPRRILWLWTGLGRMVRDTGCDVLLVPGGSQAGSFSPLVAMSQNMLPFEWREARRFGLSRSTLQLLLLHRSQLATFRRAGGLIFLTEYARRVLDPFLGGAGGERAVIPYGLDPRFRCPPRPQKEPGAYTPEAPFRLLYVSIVNVYKHQWHVVEAAGRLRARGVPVELELIGPAYGPALRRLEQAIERWDPSRSFIHYRGPVAFQELHHAYQAADGFAFASSCENLPNILLEAMASGLPIACSNRGPMPEVLGEAGVYFDPERTEEIAAAVERLVGDRVLRETCAAAAYERSQGYSWERCARETFHFLARFGP